MNRKQNPQQGAAASRIFKVFLKTRPVCLIFLNTMAVFNAAVNVKLTKNPAIIEYIPISGGRNHTDNNIVAAPKI